MLALPQGPWKPIITGNWDGIDITYYQNPEKELLLLIFDKKEEEIKGIIMMGARFFLVEGGNTSGLVEKFNSGNLVHIKKKTPTLKLEYLATVTDPYYVEFEPAKIMKRFSECYNALNDAATEVRKAARQHQISLTELKNASEEASHRLFGEPLALPTLVVRKVSEGTTLPTKLGKIKLGTRLTGEMAYELIQNLLITCVIGIPSRNRIAQILVEESVINGLTTVIFDEDGRFKNINKPNPSMVGFEKFEMSQPMGMPTRTMEPGIEVFIELDKFDKETFASFLEIENGGDGLKDIFGEALKEKPENLDELEKTIEGIKTKKYSHERAIRIIRILKQFHPELFKGKNDAREILAPWLKKMGRVTYIKLADLDPQMREGIKYSVIKAIDGFLKSTTGSREIRSLSVLDYPKDAKVLQNEYLKTLQVLAGDYGHGMVLLADSELDLDSDIRESATILIECLEENEAAVKVPGKKPYKIRPRPTLATPPSEEEEKGKGGTEMLGLEKETKRP